MVVGFNHNIRYRGEIFHVQTEDSGRNNPYIITHLYLGGIIVSTKKTSYDDIIKIENLEKVIEELMKEQHKQMLFRLKSGEFDDRAFGGRKEEKPAEPPKPKVAPAPAPPSKGPASSQPILNLDDIILDYLAAKED
jgi:hypothetical protein